MQRSIICLAVQSKILVLFIQFISNLLIPDHEAGVFLYRKTTALKTFWDKLTEGLLGGLIRWDAQYFMHIAKYGYTFENTLAFFPLYPLSARFLSNIVLKLFPFISLDSALVISFTSLNILLFCLSALTLYELTLKFFNSDFAYKTAVLFCFNPASIFFTAPYTECLFSYLSFKSMLNCVILYQKYSESTKLFRTSDIVLLTPILLSCVTRSNGILNIGFFVYTYLCIFTEKFRSKLIKDIFVYCPIILFGILYCLFPFICYQYYAYQKFCQDFTEYVPTYLKDQALKYNFVLPGEFSKHNQSWCHKLIPLSYSYVQAKYWDVGFLKYYELRQIPNFLLAFPVLMISFNYTIRFLHRNAKFSITRLFSFTTHLDTENTNIFNTVLFVYILHALALSVFSLFFIHIQVATRMLLSASPVVYWYCAYQFLAVKASGTSVTQLFLFKTRNFIQKCIKYYFLGYFVIGTILFSNYLPWT